VLSTPAEHTSTAAPLSHNITRLSRASIRMLSAALGSPCLSHSATRPAQARVAARCACLGGGGCRAASPSVSARCARGCGCAALVRSECNTMPAAAPTAWPHAGGDWPHHMDAHTRARTTHTQGSSGTRQPHASPRRPGWCSSGRDGRQRRRPGRHAGAEHCQHAVGG
jgi:hypothetical protein